MKPNRSRVKVFEAEDVAKNYVETFKKRGVQEDIDLNHDWPRTVQHVGDSLAVAYASDKWRTDGKLVLYKHLAESHNEVYCIPGFLRQYNSPDQKIKTIGPKLHVGDWEMPNHFAELGVFEEADLRLHTTGTNDDPGFGEDDDDGIVKVTVAHGLLGASKMKVGSSKKPFLFVYTEDAGILMIITGDELDVESDGIVG